MCLHDVTQFLNHKTISRKHVSIFLPRKYDVISKLCHSYAKDPFWVTRLKLLLELLTATRTYGRYATLSE